MPNNFTSLDFRILQKIFYKILGDDFLCWEPILLYVANLFFNKLYNFSELIARTNNFSIKKPLAHNKSIQNIHFTVIFDEKIYRYLAIIFQHILQQNTFSDRKK